MIICVEVIKYITRVEDKIVWLSLGLLVIIYKINVIIYSLKMF